jgi:hypothetical protein
MVQRHAANDSDGAGSAFLVVGGILNDIVARRSSLPGVRWLQVLTVNASHNIHTSSRLVTEDLQVVGIAQEGFMC